MPAFVDAHAHYFGRAIDDVGDPAAYLDVAVANGTATFGEAGVLETHLPIIEDLVASGGVNLRTNLYLCVDDPCGDSQGDWWKAVPPTPDLTARFRVAGVKIWTDGGACNRPARSSHYPDGSTGELYFEAAELVPVLAEADRLGHQIVLHALGDLAIDVAKRSLTELLGGRDNVLRHRIDHNAVLPPELRGGYAESGGIAVIFGAYPACAMLGRDPRFQFTPPPETLAYEWAWRGLIDANPGPPRGVAFRLPRLRFRARADHVRLRHPSADARRRVAVRTDRRHGSGGDLDRRGAAGHDARCRLCPRPRERGRLAGTWQAR